MKRYLRPDVKEPFMLDIVIESRKAFIRPGLEVNRILPFRLRRMVGPFIFMDHDGPVGIQQTDTSQRDVLPHPHIGLSTEPLGSRYIWWNFVSSRKDRIEQAKEDWKQGRIILHPNDNGAFIPLHCLIDELSNCRIVLNHLGY